MLAKVSNTPLVAKLVILVDQNVWKITINIEKLEQNPWKIPKKVFIFKNLQAFDQQLYLKRKKNS